MRLGTEIRTHSQPVVQPPSMSDAALLRQAPFKCAFCEKEADVLWKGTSCCKDCLNEKTRTGGI